MVWGMEGRLCFRQSRILNRSRGTVSQVSVGRRNTKIGAKYIFLAHLGNFHMKIVLISSCSIDLIVWWMVSLVVGRRVSSADSPSSEAQTDPSSSSKHATQPQHTTHPTQPASSFPAASPSFLGISYLD